MTFHEWFMETYGTLDSPGGRGLYSIQNEAWNAAIAAAVSNVDVHMQPIQPPKSMPMERAVHDAAVRIYDDIRKLRAL